METGRTCNPKLARKIEIISILISLIILALLIYSITNLGSVENAIKGNIYYYGIPGIIISSIILDMIPQFISPFIVLATSILAGFNVHLAILSTVLGSSIGALIGYYLGKRYMFQVVDCLITPKKINRMTNLMNKHGKWAVPITAMSPFPYLPILIGALNFSKKNFITYGLIPRAIGLTLFGYLISIF